ncbi:MAG TPA: enoyl-CoA hydratase/isomerase family protein [Mycobacterium sp.]|nr:enoyl-CoA hydratase/isomerase family protein [Mycobacterium sp.]
MDVDVADGVTTVRFNNPPVNASDLAFLEDVIATMRGLDGPVVLTGAGKCFSAGVDLQALIDGGVDYTERFLTALSAAFLAVFDHPAPVVAAVNGHAIAGGCVFAMCADVRLMSAGTIGLSELAVGVPFPVAPLEICRYAMGAAVTRAALQAATIAAESALARGWIDEVVGPADLVDRARSIAREMGGHSPSAFAATKQQLHRPTHAAIDAGADIDATARASWTSDETRARIIAFVESLARR